MTETIQSIVIGAGVLGLAAARALARSGHDVVVLEGAETFGGEVSSRNSEVIHAGLYYPPGTLRARLCVEGRERLYRFCAERGVGHRRIGKLIVATDADQVAALARLRANAVASGVTDLEALGPDEVRRLEPAVRCVGALLSPSTGIIDSHAFMQALLGEAEAHGAAIVHGSPVEGGAVTADGFVLRVGGREPTRIACRNLVIAAGLHSQVVAGRLSGLDPASIPPSYLAKGNYFTYAGPSPFSRLIYPIPSEGGLGVHATLDLAGSCRFGPDIRWVDRIDYDVDADRVALFYPSIRAYFPDLADGSLRPGYTGIRPKLQPAGATARDFTIRGPEHHGIVGLVALYGIDSPGLTSALAIADRIRTKLEGACGRA
jgi:L-2-hydroxyglutarate oxidase LhgO